MAPLEDDADADADADDAVVDDDGDAVDDDDDDDIDADDGDGDGDNENKNDVNDVVFQLVTQKALEARLFCKTITVANRQTCDWAHKP